MASWLVVTSQGRRVLGVFGSALTGEARRCAHRTTLETGFHAWVETFEGERPKIGDTLPAEGREVAP